MAEGIGAEAGRWKRPETAERIGAGAGRWERRFEWIFEAAPYITLAGSSALTLLQVAQTWAYRAGTIGIAAAAAVWVLLTFTLRSPAWRARPAAMLAYMVGLLAFAAVLQHRSFFFILFTIVGFVQPFWLLPTVAAFGIVALTSLTVYTASGGFPEPTVEAWALWIFLILLQTSLTGFFSFIGTKISREHQERQKLVAELEAALQENAGLHAQLLTQAREAGVLDERQRMAREIHDTLAQGLAGIITQLEAAERVREQPDQLERHVELARTLARDSLTEARRSVQALQPVPLEDAKLPDAIAEMAERWSRTSSVPLSFETTGEPKPMLAEVEATLFRVAQEALTNVGKHAMASKVGLTLSYMDTEVLLDVRDDGVGFTPAPAGGNGNAGGPGGDGAGDGHGFGLNGMAQRLRRIAGKLEIESAPGEGTAINASVPAIPAEGSR
jgi:signal transduction histidine kinase